MGYIIILLIINGNLGVSWRKMMARIAGINLPSSKRVVIALTYIHGIGKVASQKICESAGIKDALRVNDLTEQDVSAIRQYIDGNLMVEGVFLLGDNVLTQMQELERVLLRQSRERRNRR